MCGYVMCPIIAYLTDDAPETSPDPISHVRLVVDPKNYAHTDAYYEAEEMRRIGYELAAYR
jgi:hypothetical protein